VETSDRFTNRVANYAKFRPHYPREIIGYLSKTCGLTAESRVADIGCGTGISSLLFLENGNCVIGVEPNDAMRAEADRFLAEFPRFTSVCGTSSDTKLTEASIDIVVAAQAFHWFDADAARREFRRILMPGGLIVLIWNERQLNSTPFLIGYEDLLIRYAYDYGAVRHENIRDEELSAFFGSEYHSTTFQNFQDFDFEGLRGRLLSASYMPNEKDLAYGQMIEELKNLFAKYAENGRIKVLYDTNVYCSQI